MANIKLGAIITDIAGSVGGSTFRRTQSGIILYNKQGTQIKSAFSPKAVKNKLGAIITNWGVLDQVDKDFYNAAAPKYFFPDKFGNLKNLSGRQLYIKLNTQLIPTGTLVDISTFADTIPSEVVQNIYVDSANKEFIINWDIKSDSKYLLVQVTPSTKGANTKPTKKAFCTFAKDVSGSNKVNIWEQFSEQFLWAQKKSYWNVNVIFMNYSGFQNSVQSFKVQI